MPKKKKAVDSVEETLVQPEETTKKVSSIDDKLKKEFGDGIFVSGQFVADKKPVIASVSPQLDLMLGGGIKFGSFVIPTGPPKVGKTSISLHFAGNALKVPTIFDNPRHVYFFNIEGRLNQRDLLGIHTLRQHLQTDITVVQSRPGKILTGQDYLSIGEQYINEKPGCIFIFDSFSQLCSAARREAEFGSRFRDDMPLYLSDFCKRICNVIPINDSIVIGITHRIANQSGTGMSPWLEASGQKVQYEVDVKINAKFKQDWKVGEVQIGQDIHLECGCSSLHGLFPGNPGSSCISKLRYNYGLDKEAELVNLCVDLGIIKKGGSWYEIPNCSAKVQGLDKARDILVAQPDLYLTLNTQYREMMGLPNVNY